jgi:RimK-like ATP-grasp domain
LILICGIPSEGPVAGAIAAAEAAEVPYVVLNQRQEEWALALELDGEYLTGTLRGADGEWDVSRFAGVYARLVDPRTLPGLGDPPDPARLVRAEALYQALVAWLEVAPCRVVNRLGPSASNMSKPYQAQLIAACGLLAPPTTVTNDPDEVRRFAAEHGRVIYKSISSTRSIVRELRGPRVEELERVRHLPTQFQALIPGVDVRAHVVGEQVHATEVVSAATDYRYAGRDSEEMEMRPRDLPPEVEASCLALSRALELPVCGIDLRRTPEGRWFCFEANPSPAYSYYEDLTGQPIGRALVEYLAAGGVAANGGGGNGDGASD